MANVLVTGAGGFLGSWVTKIMHGAGHVVRAGDIGGADLGAAEALGLDTCVVDVTRRRTVDAAMDGIDAVVHVGGLFDLTASPERLFAINAEGARVVARSAVEHRVKRFVLISTSGVYGRCGADVDEDAPKKPINTYERSKWAGEQMAVAECKRGGVHIAALRPTLIYGPGGRYGLAPWLALLSLWRHRGTTKLPLAPGGPLGHHVHVEDVARAVELLISCQEPVDGAFNIADETPLPGSDIIRVMTDAHGIHVNGRGLPWWVARQAARFRGSIANFLDGWNPRLAYHWSMLVAELGLEPGLTPRIDIGWIDYMSHDHTYKTDRLKALGFTCKHPDVRVGLLETVEWYREQRWIP